MARRAKHGTRFRDAGLGVLDFIMAIVGLHDVAANLGAYIGRGNRCENGYFDR